MVWQERFTAAHSRRAAPPLATSVAFQPGVTAAQVHQQELRVSIGPWPSDLRSLLAETDGVSEVMHDGGEESKICWLVLPAELIAGETISLTRDTKGKAPENVVFFATDESVYFACGQTTQRVYCWYPISGNLVEVAPDLGRFVEEWVSWNLKHSM